MPAGEIQPAPPFFREVFIIVLLFKIIIFYLLLRDRHTGIPQRNPQFLEYIFLRVPESIGIAELNRISDDCDDMGVFG